MCIYIINSGNLAFWQQDMKPSESWKVLLPEYLLPNRIINIIIIIIILESLK